LGNAGYHPTIRRLNGQALEQIPMQI